MIPLLLSYFRCELTVGIAGTGSLVTSDVEGRVRIAIASTEACRARDIGRVGVSGWFGESVPVERGDKHLLRQFLMKPDLFTPTLRWFPGGGGPPSFGILRAET